MVDQNDIGTQNNWEVVMGWTDSSVPVQNVEQNQQIYSNPIQPVIQENVPQIQPMAQQIPQNVQQNIAAQPILAPQEKWPGKFMKWFIKFAAKVSGQPDPETGKIQSNTNQVNLNNQNNIIWTSQVWEDQEVKKSRNAFDSIMSWVTWFLDKVETKVEKVTWVDLDSLWNMPKSPETVQPVAQQPQQVVQNTNTEIVQPAAQQTQQVVQNINPEPIQQPQEVIQIPVNTQTNDWLINQVWTWLNKWIEGSKNLLNNVAGWVTSVVGGVSNVVSWVPWFLGKAEQKIENVTWVSLDSLWNMPTNPEIVQPAAQQPQQVVQNINPEPIQQPVVQTPVNTQVNAGLTSQVWSWVNKWIEGSRKIFNSIMGWVTWFLDKVEKKVEKVTWVNIDSLWNMPKNPDNVQANPSLISKIWSWVSKWIWVSRNIIDTAAGGVNNVVGGVGNVVGWVTWVLDKAEQKVVQTATNVLPNDWLIGQIWSWLNKWLEGSKNILSNVAGWVDSVAGWVTNVVWWVPWFLDKAEQKIENVTWVSLDSLWNMPQIQQTVQPEAQPQEVVHVPIGTQSNDGLANQVWSWLNKWIEGSKNLLNNVVGWVSWLLDKAGQKVENVTWVSLDALWNITKNSEIVQPEAQPQQIVQNTNPETITQPQEVAQIPAQPANVWVTDVSVEDRKSVV